MTDMPTKEESVDAHTVYRRMYDAYTSRFMEINAKGKNGIIPLTSSVP